MNIIVNTWEISDISPLTQALITACGVALGVALLTLFVVFNPDSKRRVAVTAIVGIIAVVATAIMLPIGLTQPRIPATANSSYIEASGTIDSITPSLNRGGTGIRLTENIDILFTIDDEDADRVAGLQGHDLTLYCYTPRDIDLDNPALAEGTALDCSPNADPIRDHLDAPIYDNFVPAIQGTERTTTTPITTGGQAK